MEGIKRYSTGSYEEGTFEGEGDYGMFLKNGKRIKNFATEKGEFIYNPLYGSRVHKGELNFEENKRDLAYSGYKCKGSFQSVGDRRRYIHLLKNGTIVFPNGDIWEGEISNYVFDEDGPNRGTFHFQGIIKLRKGEEETLKGKWICEDTSRKFILGSRIPAIRKDK